MRALVLAGGGSKGAFEVGVLAHIINALGREYDIITGVSVGALNGAWISQFPKGEESYGVSSLMKLWYSLKTEDVHVPWELGHLSALWRPSVYNSSPLKKMVRERLNLDKIRSADRAFVGVGASSLTTGKYRVFTPEHDSFVDAVLASSSFPAMLSPVEIDGEWWTDGGVRNITPIGSAIDAGATEIDIVIPSPEGVHTRFDPTPSTLDVITRSLAIMLDEILVSDLAVARMVNELVLRGYADKKRFVKLNVYRPEKPLNVNSLKFDHSDIVDMMMHGQEVAERSTMYFPDDVEAS